MAYRRRLAWLTLAVAAWLFGAPPLLAADCDHNGKDDAEEIARGESADCNKNGVPDACELTLPQIAFHSAAHSPAGKNPDRGVLHDLDQDGDLDLVFRRNGPTNEIFVLLNRGDATFEPPVSYALSVTAAAITAGDLDGDGDADLALVGSGPGRRVAGFLLLNKGDGAFELGDELRSFGSPEGICSADLDADGDLDLAVADAIESGSRDVDGEVKVLKNEGGGIFSEARGYRVRKGTAQVAAADLDGDGAVDLVAVDPVSRDIAVLWNVGDGSIRRISFHPIAGESYAVVASDLNGDGRVDLAAGANINEGQGPEGIFVLLNKGGREFQPAVNYPVWSHPVQLAVADLDGDQDPDLISLSGEAGVFVVLSNHGNGTFSQRMIFDGSPDAYSLVVGDLNGDRKPDVATGNVYGHTVAVHLNASARLADCDRNLVPDGCDIAGGAGDRNRDGIPDRCQLGRDCNANGTDDFEEVAAGAPDCDRNLVPDACEIADGSSQDSNRNGVPDGCEMGRDCNVNGADDFIEILEGKSPDCNGNIVPDECDLVSHFAFAGPRYSRTSEGPWNVAAADLDQDGDIDLATVTRLGPVSLLWNEGDGNFKPGDQLPGSFHTSISAGDFDGDGAADLSMACRGKPQSVGCISILFSRGGGRFDETAVPFPANKFPSRHTSADLDGDGDLDLAVTINYQSNPHTATIAILLNNGFGGLLWRSEHKAGNRAEKPIAADLNGDGFPDLAVANIDQSDVDLGEVIVLMNNGFAGFAPAVHYRVGSSVQSVSAGDINGDGFLDLAVGYSAITGAPGITFLMNTGVGEFERGFGTVPVDYYRSSATILDLDGEGLLDLAVVGGLGEIGLLRNEGDGTFGHPIEFVVGSGFGLASADLNGDTLPDLAIPVYYMSKVAILLNQSRRVVSPDKNGNKIPDDCEETRFLRGDLDGDGSPSLADAVQILGWLFLGRSEPACRRSADCDDSGKVDVSDAVQLLGYLFLGGPPLPEPFRSCGADPTADTLDCREHAPCR